MKRYIISGLFVPLPLFIGWVGGAEFERDPMVAFNLCAGLVAALGVYTFPMWD